MCHYYYYYYYYYYMLAETPIDQSSHVPCLQGRQTILPPSPPLPPPPTLSKTIEDSGIPVSRAATANQNVTINILREKPEEWLPCLPRKLQHSNGAEDDWLAESGKKKKNRLQK